MQHTEMKKRILPIFVLKLPDNLDAVVLDDGEQVVAHAFPEAAGGWLQEDEEASAIFSLHRQHVFESAWPSSAVIALRTSNNQPLPFIHSGLECGGIEIRKSNMDYMGELLDVIQSTIWGILPAHSHYSSSSRSLVQV